MTQTVERTLLALIERWGRPRTKGSLKVYCTKGPAHKIHLEEETKDSSLWRRQVAVSAQRNMMAMHDRLVNYAGPVRVELVFRFDRVASVVDGQPIPSHRTPFPTDIKLGDIDKLTRNVLDALVDAHVLADDSQVVEVQARKEWTTEDTVAGVEGGVWTL